MSQQDSLYRTLLNWASEQQNQEKLKELIVDLPADLIADGASALNPNNLTKSVLDTTLLPDDLVQDGLPDDLVRDGPKERVAGVRDFLARYGTHFSSNIGRGLRAYGAAAEMQSEEMLHPEDVKYNDPWLPDLVEPSIDFFRNKLVQNVPGVRESIERQKGASQYVQSLGQGLVDIRTNYDRSRGEESGATKRVLSASDMNNAWQEFKKDPSAVAYDLAPDALGTLVEFAMGGMVGKAAAPATPVVGAGAGVGISSIFSNFGYNVDASLASGKDMSMALNDGWNKTIIQAAGDALPIPLLKLELVKRGVLKSTVNRLAQTMLATGGQLAATVGSHELVDEELDPGQLFLVFGMSALTVPSELAIATRNLYGEKTRVPIDPSLIQGRTVTLEAAFDGAYLDAMARAQRAKERMLGAATVAATENPRVDVELGAMVNPITKELSKAPSERSDLLDDPGPFLDFTSIESQFSAGSAITRITPNRGLNVADEVPITLTGVNEVPPKKPTFLSALFSLDKRPHSWRSGNVATAWSKPRPIEDFDFLIQEMRNAVANADPGSAESQHLSKALREYEVERIIAEERHKVDDSIERSVQFIARTFFKALDPTASVVITNNPKIGLHRDGYGFSYTFSPPKKGQHAKYVVAVNEAQFWGLKEKTDLSGGTKQVPFFDLDAFKGTLVHEMAHPVATLRMLRETPDVVKGLHTLYQADMQQMLDKGLRNFNNLTMPKSVAAVFNKNLDDIGYADKPLKDVGIELTRKDYIFSFAEWLANKFSKVLLDTDLTGVTPELKKLARVFGSEVGAYAKESGLDYGPTTEGFRNFIQHIAAQNVAHAEKTKILLGDKRWELLAPETFSQLWSRLPADNRATASQLETLFKDESLPRRERIALARVIRAHNLDKSKLPLEMSEFARDFDAALKFEINWEKHWESTSGLTRLFTKKPEDWKSLQDTTAYDGMNVRLGNREFNFGRTVTYFMTLTELAKRNPMVRPLSDFVKGFRDMVSKRATQLQVADDVLKQVLRIPVKTREKVGEFLLDWTDGTVEDLRKNGPIDKNGMRPTFEHIARTVYGLSKSDYEVAHKITDLFSSNLRDLQQAEQDRIVRRTQRGEIDFNQATRLSRAIDAKYTALLSKRYFPNMRFGRYTLAIRAEKPLQFEGRSFDKDDLVFYTQFESVAARNAAMGRFEKMFSANSVRIVGGEKEKAFAKMSEMPYWLLEAIKTDDNLGLKPEQMQELDNIVRKYAQEGSFAKRMMKRAGVLGASTDIVRVLASAQEAFANHYARINSKSQLTEIIARLNQEIKEDLRTANDLKDRKNQGRRSGLLVVQDAMTEFLEASFKPDGRFFDAVKTFGFAWHLGWNAKSALVNLTQIPMMLYPELASGFGDGPSISAIGNAIQDVTKHFIQKKTPYTTDELLMRERLRSSGILDQSIAREMVTLASSGAFDKVQGSVAKRGMHKLIESSAYLFQGAELFNREVTSLATHRLLKKAGITDPKAQFEFIRGTIERTMFEYGKWNRPKAMRNPVVGALLLFKQYQLNALYFMARKNPAALKTAALLLGSAGIMGLPFAEDSADLIDAAQAMARDKGEPRWDTRLKLRELLNEFNANTDIMMHGVGRYGFGVPQLLFSSFNETGGPEIDISGSMSMGRIIPFGIPEMMKAFTGAAVNKDAFASRGTENIGGALGSTFHRFLDATFSKEDVWKRTEKFLPTAAARVSQALRLGTRGYETTRSGAEVLQWDVTDPKKATELAFMALGFTPTAITQEAEIVRAKLDHHYYWQGQRTVLMRQFATFFEAGLERPAPDEQELQNVLEEVAKFNEVAPADYAIAIKGLRASLRSRAKQAALLRMGIIGSSIKHEASSQNIDEVFQRNRSNPRPEGGTTIYDTQ